MACLLTWFKGKLLRSARFAKQSFLRSLRFTHVSPICVFAHSGRQNPCPDGKNRGLGAKNWPWQQNPSLGNKNRIRASKSMSRRQKSCLGDKMCVCATKAVSGRQISYLGCKIHVWAQRFMRGRHNACLVS